MTSPPPAKSRLTARPVGSYLYRLTRAALATHGAHSSVLAARRRRPAPVPIHMAPLPPAIPLPDIADAPLRAALERLGTELVKRQSRRSRPAPPPR